MLKKYREIERNLSKKPKISQKNGCLIVLKVSNSVQTPEITIKPAEKL